MSEKTYISTNDCKNGYLYRISSRSSDYGVYVAETKSFLVLRCKFGDIFIFEEDHWDIQGTAKPIACLEMAPDGFIAKTMSESDRITYLQDVDEKYFEIDDNITKERLSRVNDESRNI